MARNGNLGRAIDFWVLVMTNRNNKALHNRYGVSVASSIFITVFAIVETLYLNDRVTLLNSTASGARVLLENFENKRWLLDVIGK